MPAQAHASRRRTLTFDDAPEWLRDNPFVRTGYRPQLPPRAAALTALAWGHNETLNVWTHAAGLALFAWAAARDAADPRVGARWPLLLFDGAAAACMAASVAFHALGCVSERCACACMRADLAGIAAVMWAMYWPWVWYAFPPAAVAPRTAYLACASAVAAGTLCAVVLRPPAPGAGRGGGKAARAALFAVQGALGAAPLAHACALGWPPARRAAAWVAAQLALHALGAAVYVARVPERYACGGAWGPLVDALGGSHALFHVLVVAGLAAFHRGVLGLAVARADATHH